MNKWIKLIICILICQLAGIIGTVFISDVSEFYTTLQKPFFAPPNWLFGPVWITLYTLMGISLFLVLKKKNKNALYVFFLQLILNAVWTPLFFGLRNFFLAFIEMIILWITIIITIVMFWKINKKASYLLIPYVAWVTIALTLNYFVWILNV